MRPRKGERYVQGVFRPVHPEKYVGNVNQIFFRSSWELAHMSRLDTDPEVTKWASESVVVPYFDPSTQRNRRYFPDFLVMKKDGTVVMQEIKPESQSVAPRKGKKNSKKFLAEAAVFLTNDAKWQAAREFCKKKGWKFEVLTERKLGIRKR